MRLAGDLAAIEKLCVAAQVRRWGRHFPLVMSDRPVLALGLIVRAEPVSPNPCREHDNLVKGGNYA